MGVAAVFQNNSVTTDHTPRTEEYAMSCHSKDSTAFCRGTSILGWDTASEYAYKQTMYLAVGIGTLLLGINIW